MNWGKKCDRHTQGSLINDKWKEFSTVAKCVNAARTISRGRIILFSKCITIVAPEKSEKNPAPRGGRVKATENFRLL